MTNLTDAAATIGDKASEVRDQAEDLVRSAGKKLQEARNETAGGLHAAASSVRATGRQGSEAIGNLANNAADKLDATASCVEDYDPRDAITGLRRVISRYPARSVVIATTIGIFAGCAIRQFTHSYGNSREARST
jgi:ElaB/YqjD/DUF883 family membrane-anchored ribosome-binding protein